MKKKFLVLLTGLSAFALASCGGNSEPTPTPTPAPTPSESETVKKEVKYEFKGDTTIDSVAYNVVLSAYTDGTFLLNPGKDVKTFTGTYEFIEKVGFVFTMNDANNTVVKTVWKEADKNHEAVFPLKLGDAGTGEVTVKLHDEDFVYEVKAPKEAFLERAKFTGTLNFNGEFLFTTEFNKDGTFKLVPDKMENFLTKEGTYTFENNTFTLKSGDIECKSEFDITTVIYKMVFPYKGQEATLDLELTFDSKKPSNLIGIDTERFGGSKVILNMNADGTCLFDLVLNAAPDPKMQTMMDYKGTWDHLGPRYLFKVQQFDFATQKMVEKEFEGEYDELTNTFKMDYSVAGPEGTISYPIEGEFPQMQRLHCYEDSEFGKLAYDLIFLPEGKAWLKCTTPHPSRNGNYDDRGTFTFENNVLTFNKAAEPHPEEPGIAEEAETYTSKWDEETGTYSITYNLHLKRISKVFHPVITYTVY